MRSFQRLLLFFLILFGFSACSPSEPGEEAEILHVQYTYAAQPWLSDLEACAGGNPVQAELRLAEFSSFESADLILRLAKDTEGLYSYQVGTVELLVITNSKNILPSLTAAEARALFIGTETNWQAVGGTDADVRVWVYPAGDEIQVNFEGLALRGQTITPFARIAASPEDMIAEVTGDVHAIGILTRDWLTSDLTAAFSVASLPVVLVAPYQPSGLIAELIACLQK